MHWETGTVGHPVLIARDPNGRGLGAGCRGAPGGNFFGGVGSACWCGCQVLAPPVMLHGLGLESRALPLTYWTGSLEVWPLSKGVIHPEGFRSTQQPDNPARDGHQEAQRRTEASGLPDLGPRLDVPLVRWPCGRQCLD